MKHRYTLFLTIFGALFVAGCSETVATNNSGGTNNTSHVLLVSPDTNHFLIYQQYLFRAKVTGLSPSDLRVKWDFGDSTLTYPLDYNGVNINHVYNDTGNFTIRVKALDYFTDSLIAEKTIPIHVDLPSRDIDLTPNSCDTLLNTISDKDSLYTPYISLPAMGFKVKTQLDETSISVKWHFSHLADDITVTGGASYYQYFPDFGTYFVRAEVYDKFGNLWGKDSSTITIHEPEIDLAAIQSKNKMTVNLALDETSPIYSQISRFTLGLPTLNDSAHQSHWASTSLVINYDQVIKTIYPYYEHTKYNASLRMSSDLQYIDALSLSFQDSLLSPYNQHIEYGFNLKGLKLLGVSKKRIVYGVYKTSLSNFSSGIVFSNSNLGYQPYGLYDNLGFAYDLGYYPFAYVIFSD